MAPAGRLRAVHPADPRVLDTSEFFGEEVKLKGCKAEAIDERNLAACRKLILGSLQDLWPGRSSLENESEIAHLNTQHLQSLIFLNIVEAKIVKLDTRPLVNLQQLWMYRTAISSLDTSSLGKLQVLYAHETRLATLDTANLTSLRVIGVGDTQIRALDTRPMGKLKVLSISSTQIKFVSAGALASMKELYTHYTRISRIHTVTGWKIEELWIKDNGIRYIDGRKRMQVRNLYKDDDQTVLHDEWEG